MIAYAEITLYAPWVHSLKEKRMVVKSLLSKLHGHFNVSSAEIDNQDVHQTIVIGIAEIAGNTALADSILDHAIQYVEQNTEAEITDILREIR